MTTQWNLLAVEAPPEKLVVDTLGPGGLQQPLQRVRGLWYLPDGEMYVWYTPIFWRPLPGKVG